MYADLINSRYKKQEPSAIFDPVTDRGDPFTMAITGTISHPQGLDALQRWGIAPEIAARHGLHYDKRLKVFIYPAAPDCRNRVLYIQKTASGAKNRWAWDNTKTLPMPPLFNLENVTSRTVTLVNGEKSLMAMETAGLKNVVSWLGEGQRITEVIQALLDHGVKTVLAYPDHDPAGHRAAYALQQAAPPGLVVHVLDMAAWHLRVYGEYPPKKFDTRDLWLELDTDPDIFQSAFQTIPPIRWSDYKSELPEAQTPPPINPAPRRNITYLDGGIDWDRAFLDYCQEVKAAFERLPVKGKKRQCINPHHPDQHPSARISTDKNPHGHYVCTCGHFKMQQVGEWLGIRWGDRKRDLIAQYRASHPLPQAVVAKIEPPAPPITALHPSIREAILRTWTKADEYGNPKRQTVLLNFLRLWDVLLKEGFDGKPFTICEAQMIAAAYGFTKRSTYRLISETTIFCQQGNTRINILYKTFCVGKKSEPQDRGRPVTTYKLPDLPALCNALALPVMRGDSLTDEILETNTDYRQQAILLEVFPEIELQVKQADLAKKLRVSPSTISKDIKALKEADLLEVTPSTARKKIDLDQLQHHLNEVYEDITKAGSTGWLEMYYTDDEGVKQEYLHNGGKRKRISHKIPLVWGAIRTFIDKATKKGNEMYLGYVPDFVLCVRSANFYQRLDLGLPHFGMGGGGESRNDPTIRGFTMEVNV